MSDRAILNREFFKDNVEACRELAVCKIPSSFNEIDTKALYDWTNCKYIIVPPTIEKIAEDAFLWDKIHLVISNHPSFQNTNYKFTVFPYINEETNETILSMFEKLENLDSKIDINSEDIALKRDSINQEINNVIKELNKKKAELNKKTTNLEKIYNDLNNKTLETSQFIEDIRRKIDTIISSNSKQKIKDIELEYNKYKSLQDKELKKHKDELLELRNALESVSKEEKTKIKNIRSDFEEIFASIDERVSEMAEEISKKALDEVLKETPYKVYNVVIDNKKYSTNKPKVTHFQFEDVIKLVGAGFNPLLVGPAGCGKNVIIEQVADTLGWEFYYVNDVTEEYKVMGFVDANGHYCKTQFYDAFTKGGFIMIDELDQSNASALLAINSAIGTGYHEYAAFPDGNLYHKNPDFHIAAAANTYGNGADMRYCGRNQLDAASLNRFTPIFINYDKDLETSLVSNEGILPLYWQVRDIVDTNRIRQVISTRNIVNADKMITGNLFDIDKIFEFTIVQGMSQSDLRIILNSLNKSNSYIGSYGDKFVNYLQKVKKISLKEYSGDTYG